MMMMVMVVEMAVEGRVLLAHCRVVVVAVVAVDAVDVVVVVVVVEER